MKTNLPLVAWAYERFHDPMWVALRAFGFVAATAILALMDRPSGISLGQAVLIAGCGTLFSVPFDWFLSRYLTFRDSENTPSHK